MSSLEQGCDPPSYNGVHLRSSPVPLVVMSSVIDNRGLRLDHIIDGLTADHCIKWKGRVQPPDEHHCPPLNWVFTNRGRN